MEMERDEDAVIRRGGPVEASGHVVLHVVIHRKNAANLDGAAGRSRGFELKPIVSGISGRVVSEFGTVRPGFKSRAPDQFLNTIPA